jgi:hypothetical protein
MKFNEKKKAQGKPDFYFITDLLKYLLLVNFKNH